MKVLQKIVFTFMLIMFVSGCSNIQHSAAVNSADLVKNAEIIEEHRMEELIKTKKEDLEKHYGENLYFEDLNEIRKTFEAHFEEDIKRELASQTKVPLIVESKTVFYNQSLKEAKEGRLSYTEVLEAPNDHIRSMELWVYTFYKPEEHRTEVTDTLHQAFKKMYQSYYDKGIEDVEIIWCGYDESILKETTLKEIREQENTLYYLDTYKKTVTRDRFVSGVDTIYELKDLTINQEEIEWFLRKTKEKYNQKFVYIKNLKADTLGTAICAPIDNSDLEFQVGLIGGDKYLTVLAQYYMNQEINKILEEEEADDFIFQLSIPCDVTGDQQDRKEYNVGDLVSGRDLLEKGYPGSFDITLVYTLENEEEIDYGKLRSIVEKINDITQNDKRISREIVMVYFYKMSKKEQKMLSELFVRDAINENMFRDNPSVGEIYAQMYRDRADTDAFDYLDVYGRPLDYMLFITGDPKKFGDENDYSVMKKYKQTSIFGEDINE